MAHKSVEASTDTKFGAQELWTYTFSHLSVHASRPADNVILQLDQRPGWPRGQRTNNHLQECLWSLERRSYIRQSLQGTGALHWGTVVWHTCHQDGT
jgi:hypothetical protein